MKNVKTIPAIAAIISLSLTNGTWGQTQTSHNPHFNAETYEIFLPDSFLNTVYDDAFFGGGTYFSSGSMMGLNGHPIEDPDIIDRRNACYIESENDFYDCARSAARIGALKEVGAVLGGMIVGLFFKSRQAGGYVFSALTIANKLEYDHELLVCNGERVLRDLGCKSY